MPTEALNTKSSRTSRSLFDHARCGNSLGILPPNRGTALLPTRCAAQFIPISKTCAYYRTYAQITKMGYHCKVLERALAFSSGSVCIG